MISVTEGNTMSEQNQARLVVQVQPNARQNEVTNFENGVLQVRIAAPPIKGKANKELIEFLSKLLGINKSNLTMEKGMSSKRKVIAIKQLTPAQISERLGTGQQVISDSKRHS
jgi:hypothetical protein